MNMRIMGLLAAFAIGVSTASVVEVKADLPKTDGKPADMSKPVKVFIMLGQSNMVGMGAISRGSAHPLDKAVKEKKMYQFLLDESGDWVERKDVRNVFIMADNGEANVLHNEWLKVGAGGGYKMKNFMGTEFGIGHVLGNAFDEPVMLLKCCIGNRSIGHDLLPPGSKGFDFTIKDKSGTETTYTYAGYGEAPMRWVKGDKPTPVSPAPNATIKYKSTYGKDWGQSADTVNPWHAGIQYDWDIGNAKKALAELDKYYPGAKGYEVAGFFLWQGEKDTYDPGIAAHYEENLVNFIKSVRKDLNAPHAKFVLATLGECYKGMEVDNSGSPTSNRGLVLKGHLAVDGASGKYPEFKGNVATIYTRPIAQNGEGGAHYGKNAEVYMDVGLAMGQAMIELLNEK